MKKAISIELFQPFESGLVVSKSLWLFLQVLWNFRAICAAVLFENTKFFMLTSFLSDLMTAFAATTTPPLLAAAYREVLDYRANNSEQLC